LSNEIAHHRPKTIEVQLDGVTKLNRNELQRLWRDSYGSDPPEKISVLLMRQAIAHRLQVKHLGGLNFSTRRTLKRVVEERSSSSSHAELRPCRTIVTNGTVLVREWHGTTHQVTVTENGVRYQEKLFRSLSEVAREITGTRWSGPLFFGLRKSSRKSNRGKN
jgi:hypothetical protein